MEHGFLSMVRRIAGDPRSDADLLDLMRDDHTAFAELVARHGPLVWGVCRQLLGEADAEDAFQATFVALLRATVRDGRLLVSWLHGVAVRVSLASRREAGRRRARERCAAAPESSPPRGPDDWADTMATVHREVARLPQADRETFVLCVLEGRTQAEAAGRLGQTPGAIAGRVTRAKKRLVARLTERGVVPGFAALGTASVAGAVPAGLVDRVGTPGATIPPAVLDLAKGGLGMTASIGRLVAAAVLAGAVLVTGVLSATGPQPDSRPVSAASRKPTEDWAVKPAEVAAADVPGLVKLLQGEWIGIASYQGDVTLNADGTYTWIHYGPGDATVVGKWSMRWDALPPTLVLTFTASNDKDYIGATAEVKA